MFKIQKCIQNLRLKISLKSDIILLRQKSNDFDEGDVGMNCYRIAAFVTAVAVMASVFSGCSQVAESIVSTSNTTVSDTSQTEVTAMPEYVAEYPLSNENADEITQIAASEIESEQEEISMQHYEKIMAALPPEGIFDLQDGVIYPDFQKYTDRLSIQVQHSYEKNFLSTSKGVRKFKRFLGRLLIISTISCKSSSEISAKEVPFGKN